MATDFDVIVIGGGPAGEVAAGRAAAGGLRVALVEKELVGGECSYWACIPSKALLRPVEIHDIALQTPGVRPTIRGLPEPRDVFRHRDAMTHSLDDHSQEEWVKNAKVTLLRGTGRLAGPRRVSITDAAGRERTIEAAKAVVVAVGSRPRFPDVPGLRDIKPWTNREATQSSSAPARLIILGGGPVGLEMAYAWRALGTTHVTLLERSDALLKRFEPFVGTEVTQALQRQGVEIRFKTQAKQVRREASGEVVMTLDDGAVLRGDQVLVAAGRLPSTQDLGLESVGLKPGAWIEVDDSLRATGVPDGWLYAVGDANGRNLLTHMGKYQARLVGDALTGKEGKDWSDHHATPQVIFTQPQVASVGLTEAEARKRGHQVETAEYALQDVVGYLMFGPTWRGRAKLVVDSARRTILGATFVGIEVDPLLHSATVAIAGEVTLDRLRHAVPSFPTTSEVWLWMLEKLGI